jgi:hypothetical protein
MNLIARDLGESVEEFKWRCVYRTYAVDGLPDGNKAQIIEEKGRYRVILFDVIMPASPIWHGSIESALDELRRLLLHTESAKESTK